MKQSHIVTKPTQGNKPRPMTDVEEALDMISAGLLILEEARLTRISGKKQVDIAAKMNAQCNTLDDLLKPLKDGLKTQALSDNVSVIRGGLYKAVLRSFPKAYWKFDDLKQYLKGKTSRFQETRTETQMTFEVNP